MIVKVVGNQAVGRGSLLLQVQAPGRRPLDHLPGTVVRLSLKLGRAWLGHAYTVCGVDAKRGTLEFLIRVIPNGRLTPHLAALVPGSELLLEGQGGHPIAEEVDTGAEGLVLVSTGTGIGPLYAFSRMTLAQNPGRLITLVAGFRERQDACLEDALRLLARDHPTFKWHFSLSKPDVAWSGLRGRVTETLPDVLGPVQQLHFHLVGNGNMVVELYEALMLTGLKDERVTSEIYFNFPETLDPAVLARLAARFRL